MIEKFLIGSICFTLGAAFGVIVMKTLVEILDKQ